MIRTGEEYRPCLRDGRKVYVTGDSVQDATTHPMFRPLADIRARMHDMAHEPVSRRVMTWVQDGELNAIGPALPCPAARTAGGPNAAPPAGRWRRWAAA